MTYSSQFNSSNERLWLSGRNYVAGEKSVSPIDFCVYVRKIAGAGATDPSSDTTNWQPSGAMARKSLQRITISVAAGNSSNTGTISAVNTSKTTIKLLGGNNYANDRAGNHRVELTNSTTVTAYAFDASYSTTIGVEIEETY